MMNRLALLVFFALTANSLFSQDYPLAAGCPHGIYIFLTNRIPKDGYIQVSRSEEKKAGENLIATVEVPGNRKDLAARIKNYEPLFSDLGRYSEQDIDRMWIYIQNNNLIDTLPPVNYPVMHLAAGTACLDQDVKEGIKYTYTVTYFRQGKNAGSQKTNTVSLPPKVDLPTPVYNSKNTDSRMIYIDWQVNENPYLYSFRVYRRQNMAGQFEKINPERGFYNKGDSLFLVMNDRDVKPRTVYEYYIKPLDRLANPGDSSATVVVSDFTRNDIPVLRRFDVSGGSDDHTVRLYWKYNNPDLVRSIAIYRSEIYDSAYNRIAQVPPGDTVFIDHVPGAMENYYYYIVLQGIMDRSFPSAKVGGHAVNYSTPSPPGEVAALSTEGGVKIAWKHENPVVTGYYIYRDHGFNDSLIQASPLIAADRELMSYVDTSKSLDGNHEYHYAVVSVNDGYRLSSLSDTVSARPGLPTTVLPPSNLHGGYLNGQVLLIWDDMNPQDEYLAGYNVYRKTASSAFSRINHDLILFNTNTFSDTTAKAGNQYEYAVTSLDESGSESVYSTSVDIKLPGGGKRPVPIYSLRVSRGNNGVILTWPPESADSTSTINVFRYEAGEKPVKIANIRGENFSFEDPSVQKDHLYFYYLKVTDKEGLESEPGNKAEIRY